MKRILVLILALAFILSIAACSVVPGSSDTDAKAGNQTSGTLSESSGLSYEITYTNAKSWVNSIGTTWVQTITEITNTGSENLYLSSGAYDLEDEQGNLIASKSMVSAYPEVLAPGEKGYMYDETVLDSPVTGQLKVKPREDVTKAKVPLVRYSVSDIAFSDNQYGGIKMLARVENTSDEADAFFYIVAFLYDADGACIGQVFTIATDELASGAKIGFEAGSTSLPTDVTSDKIASYIVYAYPRQFQF